jgi:hypothetical protein
MSLIAKLARPLVALAALSFVGVAEAAEPTSPQPVPAQETPTSEVSPVVPDDGFITLDVLPTALVYFQEKLLGETPLPRMRLPAGKVELRLVDVKTKTERTTCVVVSSNKVSIFKIDLAKLPADKRDRIGCGPDKPRT